MQPLTGPALMSALLMALLIVAPARAVAQDTAIYSDRDLIHPVYGQSGMVATQDNTATRTGWMCQRLQRDRSRAGAAPLGGLRSFRAPFAAANSSPSAAG